MKLYPHEFKKIVYGNGTIATPSIYAIQNGYLDYRALSEIVGSMILNNHIRGDLITRNVLVELFAGKDIYKDEETGYLDDVPIYQDYLITPSAAEWLKNNTHEIVYYCPELDLYIWGITHFGTSWSYVLTDIPLELYTNEECSEYLEED